MTVTRGKLFATSVVSISFIIKGAGEFILLFLLSRTRSHRLNQIDSKELQI